METWGKLLQKTFWFWCGSYFYDILPNLEDEFAKQVSLEELQERADILSLHIPLDASTEYLVDENFISKMKKKFLFGQYCKRKKCENFCIGRC